MRLSSLFISAAALIVAAVLSLVAASFAVTTIEVRTEIGLRSVLDDATFDWAEVQADGLKVTLSGTAPDESTRFSVLSLAGTVVDAARVIDVMQIAPSAHIVAPRFSAEILRNDSGISIIGLIPADTGREALIDRLNKIDSTDKVSDLLQIAHYPVPRGWQDAMGFAVIALEKLPRSKISVAAGQISITAISDSLEAKKALVRQLNRTAPPGLRLALNISAPRPVITPFTLRYLIDEKGGRFDACSADSNAAKSDILSAAKASGLSGSATCVVGMGTPTPSWAKAAGHAIRAVAKLGNASVTMSDVDITLVAGEGTDSAVFDRVVGELDSALPPVFVLHAVLPLLPDATDPAGPTEFTATLSPEGLVQLRGRLSDNNLRHMADSYAKARFGSEAVYTATRTVDGLPNDWPVRVLSGLESLSLLVNGALIVTPDTLTLTGISEREDANAVIAGILADKLGGAVSFSLDITYRQPPDPVDIPPDPETCEVDLAAVQANSKISFEPGSATIAANALDTMNAIADILTRCGAIRLEIQGHTDSQGREGMNLQLSQARAQSVLNELRARRVLTSSYVALGYGESQPIADNGTEAGREDNRRIAFRLIRPDFEDDADTAMEGIVQKTSVPTTTDDAPTGPDTTKAHTKDGAHDPSTEDASNEQN
jgi:OOP family OmpA-OmpF porin